MRVLVFALLMAVSGARAEGDALQRAFIEGLQAQQAGDLSRAEGIFREILADTQSPRVTLELARNLFLQAKYGEAKVLFKEISMHSDTPWRVRDNIALFVREIEERTGYMKFGLTVVSDSNPGNLARQQEFAIGDLQVVPNVAPQRIMGLRYSAQGWLPIERVGAAYLAASYVDYPAQEFDRLTVDAGLSKNLVQSGRVRGKAGLEFGTLAGQSLYQFPYLGLDSVLAQSDSYRLMMELKLGKVLFADFDFLDATYASGALSLRRELSPTVAGTLRTTVESSRAVEEPYSYYGWELGPGISTFWPRSTFLLGANVSWGSRKYADADPFFGRRREDERTRAELTVGNKKWRVRDSYVMLVASAEENRSTIGLFAYTKTNLSVVVE